MAVVSLEVVSGSAVVVAARRRVVVVVPVRRSLDLVVLPEAVDLSSALLLFVYDRGELLPRVVLRIVFLLPEPRDCFTLDAAPGLRSLVDGTMLSARV